MSAPILSPHPNTEGLRRLLRFGGGTFADFLHSLDELPGRARLAVPDLDLPEFDLREDSPDHFDLICRWHRRGFGHVMAGLLRTMADDYGALVILDYAGATGLEEHLSIQVMQTEFSAGRDFDLAVRA